MGLRASQIYKILLNYFSHFIFKSVYTGITKCFQKYIKFMPKIKQKISTLEAIDLTKKVAKQPKPRRIKEKKAMISEAKEAKAAQTSRQPKKGLVELQQIDGKLYNKYNVKSIDELLGEKSRKYSTHDVKVYEESLNHMNSSDLQSHAISLQVMPKEDRRVLIANLVKQFIVNNSVYNNPARATDLFTKKMSQEALDIMAEGR